MKYRSEIDGLRALAVVPVVLFHAGYTWCRGGYVGVDVFFVISGYLISTIILDDFAKDRFSLLTFYERRAKRILPALVAVLLACVATGWFLMLPAQYAELGQSVAAVALFASNMLFWGQTGYFAPAAEQNPLLHTWSLAVEEQFYLLFPILLVALVRRFRARTLAILVIGFCLSLGIADWASRTYPGAAFFFAPFRAWELLMGAIAAWVMRHRPEVQQWRWGGLAAALGLLGLFAAIGLFEDTTRNPSLFTLLPTAGTTAILLWATPATFAGRFLSARPLVLVGLASYSLYLWHQPAFAFARLVYSGQAPRPLVAALLAGLVPVTWVSYRFVEGPFRGKLTASRRTVLQVAVAVSLALVAAGLTLHWANGFPTRFAVAATVIPPQRGDSVGCHDRYTPEQVGRGDLCCIGKPDGQASIALLGDSHAGMLNGVLSAVLAAHGATGVTVSGGWCAPLADFRAADNKEPYCVPLMTAALKFTAQHPEIHTVVLAAEWAGYTEGFRWGSLPRAFVDSASRDARIADNPDVFARALGRTVDQLKAAGKRVVIVRGVPEHEFDVPNALVRQRVFPGLVPLHAQTSRAQYDARNRSAEAAFAHLTGVTFVDPAAILCPSAQRCTIADIHGASLYGDGSHLSDVGAATLTDALTRALFTQP